MSTLVSILLAGLVLSAELGLVVLSFSLTYQAIGFANFAHVQFVAIGATVTVGLSYVIPIWLSVPLAMIAAGATAVAFDLIIFRRIRAISVGTQMIISAGLGLVIMAVIQYFWGVNPRIFVHGVNGIALAGVTIGYDKMVVILISLVVVFGFHVLMRSTSAGRLIRATADSTQLAEARGINSRAVVTGVWFLSGSIAALGGSLLGIQTAVAPSIGLNVLIFMFAAAVLGGLGSAIGAIVGTLVLSFGQAALLEIDFGLPFGGSWRVPPDFQAVLPFVVLVAVLAIRPTGLFGVPENRA